MTKNLGRILFKSLLVDDESSFSELYNQYWQSLFKYIIRILPDEDDVVDVIQDTFVTFWELRDQWGKLKSVKAYLFIIARNMAFKKLKANLQKNNVLEDYLYFYGAITTFEQVINANELSQIIDAEIDKLPEKMREIFVLSRKENLSYKEIAEKLKISDLTVKKQISNSLKCLRPKIDSEYISYLVILLLIDLY